MTKPSKRPTRARPSGTADISSFADITHQDLGAGSGIYRAIVRDTGEEVGQLRYMVLLSDPTVLKVLGTYTHPDWRGREIATALGERVHLDHPTLFLDLGPRGTDPEAAAFWDRQKAVQPDWAATVINDDARERVASRQVREEPS